MKIAHLISSLEEAQTGPNYDDLQGGSKKIQDYKAAKAAQADTPVAKPGTSLATVPNPMQAQQDQLAQYKQDYEKANPDMAAATKASDLSVQQSQQRANDPGTYQQNQAQEKDMGQADQVQADPNVIDVDAKDVTNQAKLAPPAEEPDQAKLAAPATDPKADPAQATAEPTDPNATPAQKQPSGAMSALKKLGGKVASGVGQAIKAAPGAVAGAAGSAVGGFAGGLKRGYQQQASGGVAPTWNTPSGATGGGAGGNNSNAIQQLSARLSNIEKRLSATSEGRLQFESKFLGKKI